MCRFKLREEGGGARYGSDHGANPMDKEASELGKKAKELKKASEALHQEERSGNKGRKWRKNMKAVEKAEATWAFTLLDYIGKLIFGIVGSAWDCCFCILLLSPHRSDCWRNDAWPEISFHQHSPNVMGRNVDELFFV
ncbi:hypothetical protein VPH35_112510 [Triticum aestivum]